MRKGIFTIAGEIFSENAKFPHRRNKILLRRVKFALQVVVSLRDALKTKDDIRPGCRPFLIIFEENISLAKPISQAVRPISPI